MIKKILTIMGLLAACSFILFASVCVVLEGVTCLTAMVSAMGVNIALRRWDGVSAAWHEAVYLIGREITDYWSAVLFVFGEWRTAFKSKAS